MTDSGDGPCSTHRAPPTHSHVAHQGRKEVSLSFIVFLCPSPSLWIPFLQLPVHLLNSQAPLICGRLESTPKWEVWPSVENLWDPGPESGTTSVPSDHPRLGLGQDPYPCGGQFQAFPVSKIGRGQRGVLRVDPGTRRESLGTERGSGTGPAPPGPLMFSPSGPVAPPSRARYVPGHRERPHVQPGQGQGA